MERITLTVGPECEGQRLDYFVSQQDTGLSRTLIADLVKNGSIQVEGKASKPSHRLRAGEMVIVEVPDAQEVELEPQDIPVPIVYEDQDLAVIDKPQGMVVHPAHGNWDQTLVNALLYQVRDLSGINGELRPGIVHRIDKDTSGLLVVAKNDMAHCHLSEQIKAHTITREYLALVHGQVPHNSGKIDAPIGRSPKDRKKMAVVGNGKPAITNYQVVKRFRDFTLVKCRLETGRTHQIRVHLAYLGHPLAGDPLYARKNALGLDGQALHACTLEFEHPRTGQQMSFQSPLPAYFAQVLLRLKPIE